MKKHLHIWWIMSRNSFESVLTQKTVLLIFFVGKILRFILFSAFIYYLLKSTETLAGYTLEQTLLFYLTFNVVDVVAQLMFREVYRFRPQVVSGTFDLTLTKPMSALFRSLMGGADVIDLATIPLLLAALIYIGVGLDPGVGEIILYILLCVNAVFIASSFHIATLGFGIMTLEVDKVIHIYRDFMNLGRFPVDIYREPMRGILTFVVPVMLMVTVPSRVLFGLTSITWVGFSLGFGIVSVYLSLKFWKYSLKYYTSASS